MQSINPAYLTRFAFDHVKDAAEMRAKVSALVALLGRQPISIAVRGVFDVKGSRDGLWATGYEIRVSDTRKRGQWFTVIADGVAETVKADAELTFALIVTI